MTDATLHSSHVSAVTSRKRMTPQDARLRTLRVKSVRLLFVGGALVAIFGLVGSVLVRLVQSGGQPQLPVVQGETLVIDKPRFVGTAKDGSKIVVTAQKATRSMSAQNGAVQLQKPVLETSDGSQATAKTGVWLQGEQTLSLDGEVIFTRSGGDKATSASALWTSSPAQLTMNGGIVLTRQNGDQATSSSAIWTSNPSRLNLNGGVVLARQGGDSAKADRATWSTAPDQLAVTGNVVLARPDGARSTSESAVWRSDGGSLDLSGGVNVVLPSGESASAVSVRLDNRLGNMSLDGQAVVRFGSGQVSSSRAVYQGLTGTLTGDGGISIISSLGTGSADRYVYETRSKRLKMSGNARVTLR